MSSSEKYLSAQIANNVATITINRPPLNILSINMLEEMNANLDEFQRRKDVRILQITGAGGKAFSAGVDIKDHLPEKAAETLEEFHRTLLKLINYEKPTIAIVDGHCLGGGCELAAACDIIIASERSQFGQPEIALGVMPTFATILLPRLVPRGEALRMILTGEPINAEKAERIGLINRVTSPGELISEAGSLAGKLLEKSPIALRLAKQAMREGWAGRLEQELTRVTRIYLDELMRTQDANEGLQAFLEKRKPIWKGV